VWPSAASWINSNIETIIFVYAFTWIFVLSSVIPNAIVGKERGVLTQYLVVLILSLLAFFMPDILFATLGLQVTALISSATILQNPFVAVFYLFAPYLFMLSMDLRYRTISKRKQKEDLVIKENHLSEERIHKILSEEKNNTILTN
jgi:membrane protein implicated in regulation of membrane protease activity